MHQFRVLISGAGVAGPALAYWLQQYGFEVTVVESAPAPRPGGQAVDVRGVAKGVVERMGLMPEIQTATLDERGIAFLNRRGRVAATMPADAFRGEGIVAEIEILRGDLSRILLDATRGPVEYVFGDRISELGQTDNGVTVRFAKRAARNFDFVIGADGPHSGVRALAFGSEEHFVRHLGGYTAFFSMPDPGGLDGWYLMCNMPGGRVAGLRPVRSGSVQVMLSFTSRDTSQDRLDAHEQKEILAQVFAGVGWRVPALLDAMWEASDFYFGSICQVFVDHWWRDRVALLGDAAYAPSHLAGLGTSMALVGAYVLAGELAASPDDPERAFSRYQEEMRTYVAQCQVLPPGGIDGYAPKSQLMIAIRNLSMRMMNAWPMRSMLAKQFQKSEGITLPEYSIAHVSTEVHQPAWR